MGAGQSQEKSSHFKKDLTKDNKQIWNTVRNEGLLANHHTMVAVKHIIIEWKSYQEISLRIDSISEITEPIYKF